MLVVIDGDVKEGYLLGENYYLSHYLITSSVCERLCRVTQGHVVMNPIPYENENDQGDNVVPGICSFCDSEGKTLFNYCPECKNCFCCEVCVSAIIQSCLTKEVEDDEHDEEQNSAVIFRCPLCRFELHLGDVNVGGKIVLSLK